MFLWKEFKLFEIFCNTFICGLFIYQKRVKAILKIINKPYFMRRL